MFVNYMAALAIVLDLVYYMINCCTTLALCTTPVGTIIIMITLVVGSSRDSIKQPHTTYTTATTSTTTATLG